MIWYFCLIWLIIWVIRTQFCREARASHYSGQLHEVPGRITGSFFHINYETKCVNELIARCFNPSVRWKRELLEVWFSGGVVLMGVGQGVSILLFTYILYNSLMTLLRSHVPTDDYSEPIVTPIMIPRTDADIEYLLLFWSGTLLVLIVHEIGHAAAASMERLFIQGFGIFFVVIFPGAYVRVEDSIQYLTTRQQLRIYSAGVWHNFCFALVAIIAIEMGPMLLNYSTFASGFDSCSGDSIYSS